MSVRIFFDTNIFLDMYRSNLQNDIKTVMKFLYQNKKYFITTEQSINEFTRNRYKILNETLDNFKNQTKIAGSSSTFLRSLTSFKKYDYSLKKFCGKRNITIVYSFNEKFIPKMSFHLRDFSILFCYY